MPLDTTAKLTSSDRLSLSLTILFLTSGLSRVTNLSFID